jgi:dihydroflavonol-4-reductase
VGIRIPLRLAYLAAGFMPAYAQWTGRMPLFTSYALDALHSNSRVRHDRAARELGYRPRPARQAIVDAVRWQRSYEQLAGPGEKQTTPAEAVMGNSFNI